MEAILVLFLFWLMTVFLNRYADRLEAMETRLREEGRLPPGERHRNVAPRKPS